MYSTISQAPAQSQTQRYYQSQPQSQNYGQYGPGGVAQGSWPQQQRNQQGINPRGNMMSDRRNMMYSGNSMQSNNFRGNNRTIMSEDNEGSSQRTRIHDRDNGWPSSDRMMNGRVPVTQSANSQFQQNVENRPPPGYYSHKPQQRMPPPGSTAGIDNSQNAGNQWSNDILDHKKYILFVLPDNDVCQEALSMVSNMNEVLVRNYQSIPATKRPPWLTGVPTVYSIVENKPFRGALCMNLLKQLSAWELKGPTDLDLASRMKLVSKREKHKEPESYIAAGNHSVGVYVPDADDDRKYVSGKIDDGDFERYQERRKQSGIYRPTGEGTPAGGIDDLLL